MPSVSLDHALGMEHHHPLVVMIGGHGGQVKREESNNDTQIWPRLFLPKNHILL